LLASIYKKQKFYNKVIEVLSEGIKNGAFSSKQLVNVNFLMGVSYFHLGDRIKSIKHFSENAETAIKSKPFFLALLRKSINQLDFDMIDLLSSSFSIHLNKYKLFIEITTSILTQDQHLFLKKYLNSTKLFDEIKEYKFLFFLIKKRLTMNNSLTNKSLLWDHLQLMTEKFPENAEVRFLKAKQYYQEFNYNETQSILSELLSNDSESLKRNNIYDQAFEILLEIYLKESNTKKALSLFDSVPKNIRSKDRFQVFLLEIYFQEDEKNKAEKVLNSLYEIESLSYFALRNIYKILNQHSKDDLLNHLNFMNQKYPDNPEVAFFRGRFFYQSLNYELAIKELLKVVKNEDSIGEEKNILFPSFQYLFDIFVKEGKVSEASKVLKKIPDSIKNSNKIKLLEAELQFIDNKVSEGLKLIFSIREASKDNYSTYRNIYKILNNNDLTAELNDHLEMMTEKFPGNAEVIFFKGRNHFKLGEYIKSLKLFTDIFTESYNELKKLNLYEPTIEYLFEAYFKTSEIQKAKELLEQIPEHYKRKERYVLYESEILFQENEEEKAIKLLLELREDKNADFNTYKSIYNILTKYGAV